MVVVAFLQDATEVIPSFDWQAIFTPYGLAAPIVIWMAYDIITLRRENSALNKEVRDMARESLAAMTRMASERKD